MLFYLVMGCLFTTYALDLLMLVLISLVARAAEIRAAIAVVRRRRRLLRRQRKLQALMRHPPQQDPPLGRQASTIPAVLSPSPTLTSQPSSLSTTTADSAAVASGGFAHAKAPHPPHLSVALSPPSDTASPQGPGARQLQQHASSGSSPSSSAPLAPPCPEPRQHLASAVSVASSLVDLVDNPLLLGGPRHHRDANAGAPRLERASTSHSAGTSDASPAAAGQRSASSASSSPPGMRAASDVSSGGDAAAAGGGGGGGGSLRSDSAEELRVALGSPGSPEHALSSEALPITPPASSDGELSLAAYGCHSPAASTGASAVAAPASTAAAASPPPAPRPYGWGFGSSVAHAAGGHSAMLSSSGGSGVSLPSSGGSGIPMDVVVEVYGTGGGNAGGSSTAAPPAAGLGVAVDPKAHVLAVHASGKAAAPPAVATTDFRECVELPPRGAAEGAAAACLGVRWPLPLDHYPLVLVQVPMYNEEAHGALVVERVCAMAWPRSRVLFQILDDSTKAHIREKVDAAAAACVEAGHPVQVLRRTNRQGYKAGAMVEGLAHVQPLGFKYCAIFDADFEPPVDFLLETIGPLEDRPDVGFVQTRWLNPYHSFLTWAQGVALAMHFDVEQRARSYMRWFFNFNGTAGVWRIQAITDAGGWEADTVVEDMDLSLRAYLAGWPGLYLPHVGCTNEVPDDLSTYKTQQYRWLCGPMQILTKAFVTIWRAKNVPLTRRLNCYWFFGRYILFAVVTLAVLAVPPVALWLEPWHWRWPEIFFCAAINFALAVYLYITPWSIAYMLFSIATGYFKAWAMLGGLLGSKKSKSWKVTAKKGAATAAAAGGADGGGACGCWRSMRGAVSRLGAPYLLEFGLFLYYAALAGLAFASVGMPQPSWLMGGYCSLMGVIFLAMSFGDAFL